LAIGICTGTCGLKEVEEEAKVRAAALVTAFIAAAWCDDRPMSEETVAAANETPAPPILSYLA